MQKNLTALLFLAASPALAAVIHLKMEMDIGESKFTPALNVNEGEWADTEQGNYTLRLKATRPTEDSVKVRTEIARISGTDIALIGKPTVVTPIDSPAEVSVTDDNGIARFRLKITPSLLP